MIDLIMLGQVPGTSIQISFAAWMVMAIMIAIGLWVWRHQTWRHLSNWLGQHNQHRQQRRELKRLERLAL